MTAVALYLLAFTDGTRYWGTSADPERRRADHARTAGPVGDRIRNPRLSHTLRVVGWWPDRTQAEAAEQAAVALEEPDRLLNRAMNPAWETIAGDDLVARPVDVWGGGASPPPPPQWENKQ